jgi:WhiB family redox-sensing transcriptional regulator
MSKLGAAPGTSDTCVNGHRYADINVQHNRDGTRMCVACAEGRKRARGRAALKRIEARLYQTSGDTGWHDRAACRRADPRLFDSLTRQEVRDCDSNPLNLPRVRDALPYCAACPVRRECREWADAEGEQGVWGGTYISREGRNKSSKGAA